MAGPPVSAWPDSTAAVPTIRIALCITERCFAARMAPCAMVGIAFAYFHIIIAVLATGGEPCIAVE
jgi:hypothetical protein